MKYMFVWTYEARQYIRLNEEPTVEVKSVISWKHFQDNIGTGHATLDSQANQLKASVIPSRGYSPYNCYNTTYSRSHSEEHILSPCRDLIHKSSALFSPIRGTNPEMPIVSFFKNLESIFLIPGRGCDIMGMYFLHDHTILWSIR